VLQPQGEAILGPATETVNRVFESTGLDDVQLDALVELMGPIRLGAGDRVESLAETD